MSYKLLIEGQRYQIQAYLSQHLSYRDIGRQLNASHSIISRELKCHTINDYFYQVDQFFNKRFAQRWWMWENARRYSSVRDLFGSCRIMLRLRK